MNDAFKQPKGITYIASYQPDHDRMLKALQILRDYKPKVEVKSDEETGTDMDGQKAKL